ncbi:MAG: hypothetical protein WC071_12685, partial [Victivallaceae bacterium]
MKSLINLLFAFVSFISVSSQATVYYIDYTTGNNANLGTISEPWQTSMPVQQKAANFSPGDQILIKRGTTMYPDGWTLSLASSGTSSEPIVIGAYGTGEAPVIDGRYDLVANSKSWVSE